MISPVQPWVAQITGLGEKLSAETLRAWQLEQVRKTIKYAKNNSVFYQQRLRDVSESVIESMSDMQHIPFSYPEDIVREGKSFVCVPQREISRITTLSTSGSLGNPKRIYFTENDLERTVDFFVHGMSTMVSAGQAVLILMSSRTENSIGDLLQKGLRRIGVSAEIHGNVKDVPAALKAARRFNCLVGIPAEIMRLCREDESLRPESVLLSADYVPESVIQGIKETWHCKVFTHYGMTETGFGGGVQCEAGLEYHLRDADLLVEIVDFNTGLPVPPGQYGEVVLTTLRNEAMPLIRYRTGDIARMNDSPCPCGGILPRLDKVMGRRANMIFLESGMYLSIHELDEIMFAISGLKDYRAKLMGGKELNLTVEADRELDEKNLTQKLPPCLEIKIEYAQVGPMEFTGKRRMQVLP